MKPLIRAATASDLEAVGALLEAAHLPTADVRSARPAFLVATAGAELAGAGALEIYAGAALLRSLVIAPQWRGRGLGHQLVKSLERQARAAHVYQIVLLTQTAREFFTRLDYRVIERAEAPAAVQASQEFAALCPASAVCLSKSL